MRREFRRRLADSPLTHAQARALVHISRNEGIRQVDLAELLEFTPMTLARLLDQLEALRLVERRADPLDRRAYRIHLRPAAATHLAAIDRVAKTVRARALRGVGADEAALMRALETIRDNLASQ